MAHGRDNAAPTLDDFMEIMRAWEKMPQQCCVECGAFFLQ
jgi:hypothetical protein